MSKKKKNNSPANRGSIQAQGEHVQQSESWATDKPVTKNDGYVFIDDVKDKLTRREAKAREKQFEEAKEYVKNNKIEVVKDAFSLSFDVPQTERERVDIEVNKGKAFCE